MSGLKTSISGPPARDVRPRRRVAALVTVGVLALGGTSAVGLSGAAAYPLHFGALATNKVPRLGERLTVSGSGFAPGSRVRVLEIPGPHRFKVVRANAAGAIRVQITLPEHLKPGTKVIEAIGSFPGGGELILRHSFVVRHKPRKHPHHSLADIPTYAAQHPAAVGVAGGGAIAALSAGGLVFARRRRLG